ncbi:replication initiation protein, partial [Listeria fleischmannii]
TLEVQVSERFDYIINKLNAEFTQFELAQFTNIRSTYAKEMFKFLKQWRTIGKKEYNLAEFREMLQIPKSYKAKDVSERVLKPIIEELDDYFIGIKVRPIKSRKRGTPIIAYEFTWQQEKTGEYVEGKYDNKKTEILPDWFSSSDNTSGKQTTEKLSGEELEQKVNNIKNILKNRD